MKASNLRPSLYRSAALPSELIRRKVERSVGLEPTIPGWKPGASPNWPRTHIYGARPGHDIRADPVCDLLARNADVAGARKKREPRNTD